MNRGVWANAETVDAAERIYATMKAAQRAIGPD